MLDDIGISSEEERLRHTLSQNIREIDEALRTNAQTALKIFRHVSEEVMPLVRAMRAESKAKFAEIEKRLGITDDTIVTCGPYAGKTNAEAKRLSKEYQEGMERAAEMMAHAVEQVATEIIITTTEDQMADTSPAGAATIATARKYKM